MLSHDIDQVHDREMWRILADINHLRRMMLYKESGNARLAIRRIRRAMFKPKNAMRDFETILDIEARFGFRSTFFLLNDRYWARNGARFRLTDPPIGRIVRMIVSAGCEIGLHGGVCQLNNTDAYRRSRAEVENLAGEPVIGIRNHMLRFTGIETWRAQAEAGFEYDSTCNQRILEGLGIASNHPFLALSEDDQNVKELVELPLTLMDVTLFRSTRWKEAELIETAWRSIEPVINAGGLVTLLWHNNYFNEDEYKLWQVTYVELLRRLAVLNPWCAPGREIARTWHRMNMTNLPRD